MGDKGVAFGNPTIIHDSIKNAVQKVLEDLPAEEKMFVRIDIELAKGTNVVFGYRDVLGDNKWKIDTGAWIGKDWTLPKGVGWNAGGSIRIGMLK